MQRQTSFRIQVPAAGPRPSHIQVSIRRDLPCFVWASRWLRRRITRLNLVNSKWSEASKSCVETQTDGDVKVDRLLRHHPWKVLQVEWVMDEVRVKRCIFLGSFRSCVRSGGCVVLTLGCEDMGMDVRGGETDENGWMKDMDAGKASKAEWMGEMDVMVDTVEECETEIERETDVDVMDEDNWMKSVDAGRESEIKLKKRDSVEDSKTDHEEGKKWAKDEGEGVRSWEEEGNGHLLPWEISGDSVLREGWSRREKGRKEDVLVTSEREKERKQEIEDIIEKKEDGRLRQDEKKSQDNKMQELTEWRNGREEELQKLMEIGQEMEWRNRHQENIHQTENREQGTIDREERPHRNVQEKTVRNRRAYEQRQTQNDLRDRYWRDRDTETPVLRHRYSHTNTTTPNHIATTHVLHSNPDAEPSTFDTFQDDLDDDDPRKYSGDETTASETEYESDESEDEEDEWLSLIGPRGENKWVRCQRKARRWIRAFEYAVKLLVLFLVLLWAKRCWPGELTWR